MENFGDNLRRIREEKGVSMKKAAADMGIPYTTYLSYEYGRREPSIEMLLKLSDYFQVSTDELLGINKETPEDVPLENVYSFLIESGFVKDGEDLSEEDLSFLTSIIAALRDWFLRSKNA